MINFVVQALAEKGLSSTGSGDAGRSFADVPPAITYLLVSYLDMLQDSRIVDLIHNYYPREPVKSWPTDIPPSGLLALLFDHTPEVSSWARRQCQLCQVYPIPMENFSPGHMQILKAVSNSISLSQPMQDCLGSGYKLITLQDVPALWTSYTTLLRFVPIELLRSSRSFDLDIRHVIVGHLHDVGNRQLNLLFRSASCADFFPVHICAIDTSTRIEFVDVLKGFILVLKRVGQDMWKDEGPEYAHVVFNSIKDNTRYADVLCNLPSPLAKDDWHLKWIESYTSHVATLPAFSDILPSILQFLCEQLQHERFKVVRPNAMTIAARVSSARHRRRKMLNAPPSYCSLS